MTKKEFLKDKERYKYTMYKNWFNLTTKYKMIKGVRTERIKTIFDLEKESKKSD